MSRWGEDCIPRYRDATSTLRAAQDRIFADAVAAAEHAGARMTREIESCLRHVAALSAAPPALEIRWLSSDTPRTNHHIQHTAKALALAYPGRGLIVTSAVTDLKTYARCLHELGHHRAEQRGGTLARETAACAWARDVATAWDESAEDELRSILNEHIRRLVAAGSLDIAELHAAERAMTRHQFNLKRHALAMKDLKR